MGDGGGTVMWWARRWGGGDGRINYNQLVCKTFFGATEIGEATFLDIAKDSIVLFFKTVYD